MKKEEQKSKIVNWSLFILVWIGLIASILKGWNLQYETIAALYGLLIGLFVIQIIYFLHKIVEERAG